MTDAAPQATHKVVKGYKKNPYQPDKKEMRIHYSYTRRTGRCPNKKHLTRTGKPMASSLFIGINEHGWIFRCKFDPEGWHFFMNTPPTGEPE